MTESNSPESSSAEDREYDRLDATGQFSNEQIHQRMKGFSSSLPRVPEPSPPPETITEALTSPIDPYKRYSLDDLSAAHEALASGEINDFNGLNQAGIADEITRRYQEAVKARNAQTENRDEDVVH